MLVGVTTISAKWYWKIAKDQSFIVVKTIYFLFIYSLIIIIIIICIIIYSFVESSVRIFYSELLQITRITECIRTQIEPSQSRPIFYA